MLYLHCIKRKFIELYVTLSLKKIIQILCEYKINFNAASKGGNLNFIRRDCIFYSTPVLLINSLLLILLRNECLYWLYSSSGSLKVYSMCLCKIAGIESAIFITTSQYLSYLAK